MADVKKRKRASGSSNEPPKAKRQATEKDQNPFAWIEANMQETVNPPFIRKYPATLLSRRQCAIHALVSDLFPIICS